MIMSDSNNIEIIQTKQCTKCGKVKPVSEFNKSDYSRDGYSCYCKDCSKSVTQNNANRKRMIVEVNPEKHNITIEQWRKIIEIQCNKCVRCGKEFSEDLKPHMDHIITLGKGGVHSFENVQALCKYCNAKKGRKIDHQLIQSWGFEPVEIEKPVMHYPYKMMTIEEYAEYKKIGVQVVRREIGKGNIKAEKIGRSWRIPVEDD